MRQKIQSCCFSLSSVYISTGKQKKTDTHPPKKPTSLCNASKMGQSFPNMTQFDIANAQTPIMPLLNLKHILTSDLGLSKSQCFLSLLYY